MTFKNLQDRVMERLKLTSTEARARVKDYLSERYRAVATSVGMGAVRYGTVSLPTVASTSTYSPATLIHPITVTYAAGSRQLPEYRMDALRGMDPALTKTGPPEAYAIENYNAVTVTLFIWPIPDAIYTLSIDGILTGTDMSADGDIPVLPEDFHDVLLFGAVADELTKLEKLSLAADMESRYEKRLRELRYFIAKTAYLGLQQNEQGNWWLGRWYSYYWGPR